MSRFSDRERLLISVLLTLAVLALGWRVLQQWGALADARLDAGRAEQVAAEAAGHGRARTGPPLLSGGAPQQTEAALAAVLGQAGLGEPAVQSAGRTPLGSGLAVERFQIVASGDPAAAARLADWVRRNRSSAALDRISLRAGQDGRMILQADLGVVVAVAAGGAP
jgi:hypothetical protein